MVTTCSGRLAISIMNNLFLLLSPFSARSRCRPSATLGGARENESRPKWSQRRRPRPDSRQSADPIFHPKAAGRAVRSGSLTGRPLVGVATSCWPNSAQRTGGGGGGGDIRLWREPVERSASSAPARTLISAASPERRRRRRRPAARCATRPACVSVGQLSAVCPAACFGQSAGAEQDGPRGGPEQDGPEQDGPATEPARNLIFGAGTVLMNYQFVSAFIGRQALIQTSGRPNGQSPASWSERLR